jgi:hypothetical protein
MMNGDGSNKRNRTEEGTGVDTNATDATDACFLLNGSLRTFMGGESSCKKTDLTVELLLRYLQHTKKIDPRELVDIAVTQLGGTTIYAEFPKGDTTSSIFAVKNELARLTGIPRERQTLFYAADGTDTGTAVAIGDDVVLGASCELVLFVGDTQFTWDAESDAMNPCRCPPVFELHDPRTAERIVYAANFEHALSVVPQMTPDAGKVWTVSFRVTFSDDCDDSDMYYGLVTFGIVHAEHRDYRYIYHDTHRGILCDTDDTSWRIFTNDGFILQQRGRSPSEDASISRFRGKIPFGTLISMTLNFETGTLAFFVDGIQHGEGFTDIPTDSALRWAVTAPLNGTIIEIVPNT